MPDDGILATLQHPKWGLCDLIRVEATDWIVRFRSTRILYRFPSETRAQFELLRDITPSVSVPVTQVETDSSSPVDSRSARRVIESLRIGLPSFDGTTRRLAVGFDEMEKALRNLLHDVDGEGGQAMIFKGAYGQGKTFALSILAEVALESGYLVARTEIDATENRLNKPHHIYRDLMRNLKLPGSHGDGVRQLAYLADESARKNVPNVAPIRYEWLEKHTGCFPLAWILSDPDVTDKAELLGLLAGDPAFPASRCRQSHVWRPNNYSSTKYWPAFSAGTQGDFGSYILSGIGRLARLLGFKGFIIIMDEMEKWQELNWKEQMQAGNLLGGLVWGATAKHGKRGMHNHPPVLAHSHRWGGYPFTTEPRCHVGIAIAMTPRDGDEPEHTWCQYGLIEIAHLPRLTERRLNEYCRLVAPHFAKAFGVEAPDGAALEMIAAEAVAIWQRQSELTTRSGVHSAIAAFDQWRDRNHFGHPEG